MVVHYLEHARATASLQVRSDGTRGVARMHERKDAAAAPDDREAAGPHLLGGRSSCCVGGARSVQVAEARHGAACRAQRRLVIDQRRDGRAVARRRTARQRIVLVARRRPVRVGVRLLDRSTHEVQVTDAGELLLERGRGLLHDADALWTGTREFATGTRGRLTVGYSTSSAYETAPWALATLRSALPSVAVKARVVSSVELPAAVTGRDLDLALVRCPREEKGLSCVLVRREALGVLVPAGHPWQERASVSLEELTDERLVLHERAANPAHYDLILEACRGAGFEPRLMSLTAPFDPAFGLIADGTALVIVGESVRHGLPAAVAYTPLEGAPQVQIGLLTRDRDPEPHVSRARAVLQHDAAARGWIPAHPEAA